MKTAKGGFEIKKWDETPAGGAGGPKVTRATVTQKFTGDIKGSLNGKRGSFALRLRGYFDGKRAVTKWEVVPGAGKGALKGLTGKGGFGAPMGSQGKYTLTYKLTD